MADLKKEKYDYQEFIEVDLQHKDATGFAIKKKYYREGAERAAFFMTEVNKHGKPIGEPLMGKISIHEEPD